MTPSWMSIDIIKGVIHIEGTPRCVDIGKFLIICTNIKGFTIKQFKLKVSNNNEQTMQENLEQIKIRIY